LDIDASKGTLTIPVAAIFPARFAEPFMKRLRDEFSKSAPQLERFRPLQKHIKISE
jgi:hypothetical protein